MQNGETLLNEVKEHYDHPLEVDISGEAQRRLTRSKPSAIEKKDGTLVVQQ